MRPGASWFSVASALAGHRRDAVGRHQHAGAEPDLLGVHRRRAHGDEAVGAQHLGVVEPGVAEAELLGALHDLAVVRRRRQGDAEVHGRSRQTSARVSMILSRAAMLPFLVHRLQADMGGAGLEVRAQALRTVSASPHRHIASMNLSLPPSARSASLKPSRSQLLR
jgi:hypothetical protein